MVLEANKEDSEKCYNIAYSEFLKGNHEKAKRFAIKSENMYPSMRARQLLERLLPSRELGSLDGNPTDNVLAVRRVNDSRNKNFYEILGITKNCSTSDITQAYKKLALLVHPDKNDAKLNEACTEAIQILNKANGTLADPDKRKAYDCSVPNSFPTVFKSPPTTSSPPTTTSRPFVSSNTGTHPQGFNPFFTNTYRSMFEAASGSQTPHPFMSSATKNTTTTEAERMQKEKAKMKQTELRNKLLKAQEMRQKQMEKAKQKEQAKHKKTIERKRLADEKERAKLDKMERDLLDIPLLSRLKPASVKLKKDIAKEDARIKRREKRKREKEEFHKRIMKEFMEKNKTEDYRVLLDRKFIHDMISRLNRATDL